jgi:hypothetical protein
VRVFDYLEANPELGLGQLWLQKAVLVEEQF